MSEATEKTEKPEKIDVLINMDFAGHKKGDIIVLDALDGLPTDLYWRRRLRDSALDGCCEIVEAKNTKKSKRGNAAGGSD